MPRQLCAPRHSSPFIGGRAQNRATLFARHAFSFCILFYPFSLAFQHRAPCRRRSLRSSLWEGCCVSNVSVDLQARRGVLRLPRSIVSPFDDQTSAPIKKARRCIISSVYRVMAARHLPRQYGALRDDMAFSAWRAAAAMAATYDGWRAARRGGGIRRFGCALHRARAATGAHLALCQASSAHLDAPRHISLGAARRNSGAKTGASASAATPLLTSFSISLLSWWTTATSFFAGGAVTRRAARILFPLVARFSCMLSFALAAAPASRARIGSERQCMARAASARRASLLYIRRVTSIMPAGMAGAGCGDICRKAVAHRLATAACMDKRVLRRRTIKKKAWHLFLSCLCLSLSDLLLFLRTAYHFAFATSPHLC